MTDQKITDLTPATTPLDGAEIIYAVQSGADVQATLAELPISTATQTALDAKLNASKITVGTTSPVSPSLNDLWVDTN